MDIVNLAVGLVSGAVGGNVAGGLLKSGMGTLGRSITGIAGGVGLSQLAPMIPGLGGLFGDPAATEASMSGIAASLGSGVVGGGLLSMILGKVMGNKT